jgi:hypothetical protein
VSGAGNYSAYRDADGQPLMTPSCVLFFDILGTRQMSRAPDALEHLRLLRPALEAAVERAGTDEPVLNQASTWFTDNAVVATPLVDAYTSEAVTGGLQVAAAYLLLVCWGKGFLGRGAISVGDHYMDERFVFGPALVEAVELEKRAQWPRVVLGQDAISLERQHSAFYANPLTSAQSGCLSCDDDETIFVDHLGVYIDEEDDEAALDHFLTQHRRATEHGLEIHLDGDKPWEKWRWLAEYQNHALTSRLANPEPYMVDLGEQRHQFRDFLDEGPYTPPGSAWYVLDRQSRAKAGQADFLPDTPGVYAFYRSNVRAYVGATGNLLRRVDKEHLGRSVAMANSALRRNLAEMLGVGDAAAIRERRVRPSTSDVDRVAAWLDKCEIGWQECETEGDALALVAELRREHLPPLNSGSAVQRQSVSAG